MSKELVLEIKNGGIGDHLFYSHIPRIAKETGAYEKVYLSNRSNLRNPDYRHFLWELNPHLDGFIDKGGRYPTFQAVREGSNILDEIMLELGLDDGKRYHEPELYYQPKMIRALENSVLYDPNYLSSAGFVTAPTLINYLKDHQIQVNAQLIIRSGPSIPILDFDYYLKTTSFENFIDILYSVKELYCLVTGTATLASALKRKATVFYTKDQMPMFRHSKINNYVELQAPPLARI
ncbi:MAG TPA: hypothetical protein VFA52_02600 [Candidatus Paceibacterota bacterium]|nr:hypothetical protein [Candidatus Paceibacterota bacterium]